MIPTAVAPATTLAGVPASCPAPRSSRRSEPRCRARSPTRPGRSPFATRRQAGRGFQPAEEAGPRHVLPDRPSPAVAIGGTRHRVLDKGQGPHHEDHARDDGGGNQDRPHCACLRRKCLPRPNSSGSAVASRAAIPYSIRQSLTLPHTFKPRRGQDQSLRRRKGPASNLDRAGQAKPDRSVQGRQIQQRFDRNPGVGKVIANGIAGIPDPPGQGDMIAFLHRIGARQSRFMPATTPAGRSRSADHDQRIKTIQVLLQNHKY